MSRSLVKPPAAWKPALCRIAGVLLLLTGLSACSGVNNPVPVATYDGLYVGRRQSNDAAACGTAALADRTSARVSKGQLSLDLFSRDTKMAGTVGEDGTLRASGLWRAPGSFIAITVLTGKVTGTALTGVATNSRCTTEINLTRQGPPKNPPQRPSVRAPACDRPGEHRRQPAPGRPAAC